MICHLVSRIEIDKITMSLALNRRWLLERLEVRPGKGRPGTSEHARSRSRSQAMAFAAETR